MTIPQNLDLAMEQLTSGIFAPIMIAKNHRSRDWQSGNRFDQTQIPITEITHKQHSIRLQLIQKSGVKIVPLAMQISGDGQTQPARTRRLHGLRCRL